MHYQNEEEILEEEECNEIRYLLYDVSDYFELLTEFQEEIIQNLNEDVPLSIPVIRFITNFQTRFHHFVEFIDKKENQQKYIIKIALQLVDSIIRSKRSNNYKKMNELLSYFKDDILGLFNSSELINIFINDKQSVFILYNLKLIKIQDVITIPFSEKNNPNYLLSSINDNIVRAKSIPPPKNNSNSLIRRSFSSSASIFNANSNLDPISNLNSTKLPVNFMSISSSGFNMLSRKLSFDFSLTASPNLNNIKNSEDLNISKFELSGSPNDELISIFHPEIAEYDSNFINIFPSLFEESKKFFGIEKDTNNSFFKFRNAFQNESPIAQSIINDNVEELQNFILSPLSENIESIIINHSIFERMEFLNDKQNPPKLLEFAAFCGSIKIFKFLILSLHGNSNLSILPPLHLYQQQQFEQREQFIRQQRDQLLNLQSKQNSNQIGLVQMQQQMHIHKQHEQLIKYQIQYQENFLQQQIQFRQQQQKQIVEKMPPRLHLFACAGGNAEIIHIIEHEGVFSDDTKKKESIEISIRFHQNDIFDYLMSKYNITPTIDMLIASIKSCNYYCFCSLFDQYHTFLVIDINKKGKEGENVIHIASSLGRLTFIQFLTSIDFELEKELYKKNGNSDVSSIGININLRDPNGFSALHLAAAGGHVEIIKYLVSFYIQRPKHKESNQTANLTLDSPFLKLNSLPNLDSSDSIPVSQIDQSFNSPPYMINHDLAVNLSLPRSSFNLPSPSSIQITSPTLPSSSPIIKHPTQNSNSILKTDSLTSPNVISISSPPNANLVTNSSPLHPNLISNSKSAPSSPKLITLPNSNSLSSNSTSIRRKINANSVSFSKTISLGNLSISKSQSGSSNFLNLNVRDFRGRTAAQLGYENGFSDVPEFLISQSEFDVNAKDDSGIALIHLASMQNDLNFLMYLTKVAKDRINVNIETKQSRQTAFLIAASNGNIEMVKYLIGLSSVNKKCRDIHGQMAHHIACSSESKKKSSSNAAERDKDEERRNFYIEKYTNYYLKQNIRANNTKNVDTDKDKGVHNENDKQDVNNDVDDITKKSDEDLNDCNETSENVDGINNTKSIEKKSTTDNDDSNIIENDKNTNNNTDKKSNEKGSKDDSSVSEAEKEFFHLNNLDVLIFLVGEQGFDANEKDNINQTPLHHACTVGDLKLVEFLSSVKGVDINSRDKEGRTPLVIAFINDNLDIAKFLIETTKADIKIADNDGRNSLHLSAQGGHYDNVLFIFSLQDKIKQKLSKNAHQNRHRQNNSLIFNEADEDDDDNDKDELNDSLDLNRADNYGRTCLHLSFESGNVDLIKFILNRPEIDLNARDKGGRTLLHFAASFNYLFIIDFLSSQGPIPRKIGYNGGNSYRSGNYGFRPSTSIPFSHKFDMKNVNAKANHDWTALHFAAAGGFVEMCDFLVSVKYVNANARDSTGMTPLHLAVQHEKIDAVKFLIKVPEVYVNSQDNEGRTPLHVACSMGQVEVIKVLVNCKEIDLTRQDKKSQTAFKHLAVEYQKSLAYLFK